MPFTLTICNHKGGTGKTTTAIHLAAALGLGGARVLVLDLDPQGFLTHMTGAEEPEPAASTLNLFDTELDPDTVPVIRRRGFELIGATQAMTRAQRKLTQPIDVLRLREALRKLSGYDVVVIDTAAAVSVFTMNALAASDAVVIPVTPEYQPVVGAEQTWQTCGLVQDKLNPNLQVPAFLLTQVDARLKRHEFYAKYLRETYGEAVMDRIIRTSSSLATARSGGKTVFDTDPTARGAVDYANAAEAVQQRFGIGPSVVSPSRIVPEPPEDDAARDSDPSANGAKAVHAAPVPTTQTPRPPTH